MLLTALCLIGTAATLAPAKVTDTDPTAAAKAGTGTPQAGYTRIIVNGRTLTGPNSSARMQFGRIAIPAASLARALGDSISVETTARRIVVRQQGGTTTTFDAALGQATENGAVVLAISNSSELVFPANPDELLIPSEIASVLFGVAIRFDQRQNAVLVNRGFAGSNLTLSSANRGRAELYQASYEYSAAGYYGSLSQNLSLNAAGRLGDGRFNFMSDSSGSSLGGIRPRRLAFDLERPNGQHFTLGDFGSGAALPLITANVRGAMASMPLGSYTVAAFGGRSASGSVLPLPEPDDGGGLFRPRDPNRYDSTVLGGFLTSNELLGKKVILSAGGLGFSGPARNGQMASTSLNYGGSMLRLQADLAVGRFKGTTAEDRRADGMGTALDLAATFQLAENISIQGRYAHVGANFLSPQAGMREPIDLKAAGLTWSPAKWLTASFNASTARRPFADGRAESFASAAFGITPGGAKPRIYLSHTQSSSRLYRSGAFTLINASKEFQGWRLYVNATRIKTIGAASVNAQFGVNISVNDTNSLELSQGIGNRKALNGLAEWRTSRIAAGRLSLAAGIGYSRSTGTKVSTFEKLTAALALPRQTSVNISYMHTQTGPALLVQIRGTLFKKREASAFLNALPSEANRFSTVTGRVYQDVDANGAYDPAVDKAQSNVKVRVDGNRYVETDANGVFNFEAISSGGHKVYLDLLSVRADLTLVDGGSRELDLSGGSKANLDFRLVRTGRIAGRVWLDANGNGKLDSGEQPLADIRIVTASGRDTMTDADGYFTIADLAPGEHIILIDEKTLPEKTVAGAKPLAVQVFAGRETNEIELTAIPRPAEIKRFGQGSGK